MMADRRRRSPEGSRRRRKESKRSEHDEVPRMRPGASTEYLSSSSSSSSSYDYIDISRTFPANRSGIRTFFTAPSERRRLRRRRSSRFFKFNNSSSSSVDGDLAYGTGFLKAHKRRSVRSRKGKEIDRESQRYSQKERDKYSYSDREKHSYSDRERFSGSERRGTGNTNAEILAVGAGLAKLARDQNKLDLKTARSGKKPEVIAVKETSHHNNAGSRGLGGSRISYGSDTFDEEGWESASDVESDFSVDSRLAFGDQKNTDAWGWGKKRQGPLSRKDSVVDPRLFGPANSLHGIVTEPVGFEDVSWTPSSDFGQRTTSMPIGPNESLSGSQSSLQRVFPVPTTDPSRFEAAKSSVASGSEPYISSRPGPAPLQHPQPITPVSQSIYDPPYSARSESGGILKKTQQSSGRGKSLAEAALVGVAGAAIGAAIVSDRKDDRKDKHRDDGIREEDRLRRFDGDKKESKDERRRDKRDSPDRDQRKEKRREKERQKDGSRYSSDDLRREKKREKRRDPARDDGKDERREKRREERRSARSDVSGREDRYDDRKTKSEAAVSAISTVDPFMFQVDNDAFPTPTAESSSGHRRVDSFPTIVTVEREPDFGRKRSSSIKELPSSSKSDAPKEYPWDDKELRGRDKDSRDRTMHDAESIYQETEHSTAPIAAAAMGAAVAAVAAESTRSSRSDKRRDERRKGRASDYDDCDSKPRGREPERDPVQEEADRAYREIVMARKIASQVIRSRSASPDPSVVRKYDDEEEIIRIVTPPGMEDYKKKGPYDAPNADFRPDYEIKDPRDLRNFSLPTVSADRSNPESGLKRDPDATKPRPLLNLVYPTPTPSPLPEKQAARSESKRSSKSRDHEDSSRSETARSEPTRSSKSRDRADTSRSETGRSSKSKDREDSTRSEAASSEPGRSSTSRDKDESTRSETAWSEPVRSSKAKDRDDKIRPSASEGVSSPTTSTVSKGVTWGQNETKHFEVESPSEHKDEFVSSSDMKAREPLSEPKSSGKPKSGGWGAIAAGIMGAGVGAATASSSDTSKRSKENENNKTESYEYRGVVVEPGSPSRRRSPPSTGPKPSTTGSSHVPGAFDDDLDFTATVAAGLQDTGFDPNIVINDPSFRRRDSPPGSNETGVYRTPYAETVSDLGAIAPNASAVSGSSQGFVMGELASTPQEWRSVSPDGDESSRKLSKKEQKKRDKATQRQSGDIATFEETPTPKAEETETYFEPKLSKKEQKKRDKEAKRQSSLAEDITPIADTSVSRDFVEEPESYFEPAKKSKKSKRDSTNFDELEQTSFSPDASRDGRKVSVPVDAFDDLRNEEDEWAQPKSKKKSKRDSDRYDSPARSVPSEVGSELERSSSKKSKDKSKRKSVDQYEPDPAEVSLPPSTPSETSRDGDYDDRKSRKSSSRDSGIFDNEARGDSRSVVSARYDDEPRKSKKKSRSGTKDDFDDTRSVASAPAGDDFEDSKKSKDKRSSGSFFGLFGSKSESGARDDSPKRSKDDFDDVKKKKKSKRSSVPDASSLYGDLGATSVNDLSRSVSNGHGSILYDDDFDSGVRSDGERKKTRSRAESASSKKDSFLGKAGTLGAGVGLAGAAVAIAAQHHQQSKADHAYDELDHRRSSRSEEKVQKANVFDYEIKQREFRPSIDPQYGDLLPLPPSNPASPNIDQFENLPDLPDSGPETPEAERLMKERSRNSARKSLQGPQTKSPSHSAVPLKFIMGNRSDRSTSTSPGLVRSSPLQSPATPSQDSTAFSRPRHRPTSSWDSAREYKPLYLVESSRRSSQVQVEEEDAQLPELPASRKTSRSSSQPDNDDEARGLGLDFEKPFSESHAPTRQLSIDIGLASSAPSTGLLDSQQSTPKAGITSHDIEERPRSPSGTVSKAIAAAGLVSTIGYFASSPSHRTNKENWLDDLPSVQQQPSPIDAMTKNRSSYLLHSSPMSRKDDLESGQQGVDSPLQQKSPIARNSLDSIEEQDGRDVFGEGEDLQQHVSVEEAPLPQLPRELEKGDDETEAAEGFSFTKSKKDKKKDKKKEKGLIRSSTRDEISLPEPSVESIAQLSAPGDVEPEEEFSMPKSRKDKKKGKSAAPWEPGEEASISQQPQEPIPKETREIVETPAPVDVEPSDEFSLPKSKKDKKKDKKKGKSLSSWEPEEAATALPQVDESVAEASRNIVPGPVHGDIESPPEFTMPKSKKDKKKDKAKTLSAWEPEETQVPESSSREAEPEDESASISTPKEIEEAQEFVMPGSKKNKKKGKRSQYLFAKGSLSTEQPGEQPDDKPVEITEPIEDQSLANKMIEEPEKFVLSGSKKSKKKSRKSQSWEDDFEPQRSQENTPATETPLETKSLTPTPAEEADNFTMPSSKKGKKKARKSQAFDFEEEAQSESAKQEDTPVEVAPEASSTKATPIGGPESWETAPSTPAEESLIPPTPGYFPSPAALHSLEKRQASDGAQSKGYFPSSMGLLPVAIAGAAGLAAHESAKHISQKDDHTSENSESKSSEFDIPQFEMPDVQKPTPDGLAAGYQNDQLSLARQLQEEFSSGSSKKSKKDKKKRQSLPSTPDPESSRSRNMDEAADLHPRARSLSIDPTAGSDQRNNVYSADQLELARQLQADFEKGSKKSKKDKKKRGESLDPSTRENIFDRTAGETTTQKSDLQDAPSLENMDEASKEDGFAAGYQEDQLSLARQLQAEFGSGSKKSKKDKKRRSASQMPQEQEPSNDDDFGASVQDPVLGTTYSEEPASISEPSPGNETARDGLAVGYKAEQLEFARQLKEEFGSGFKKTKKDKKDKKSQSLGLKSLDDFSGSIPAGEPDESLRRDAPAPQSTEAAPSEPLNADPEDEFASVTKKSKKDKKEKKRDSLAHTTTAENLPSDAQVQAIDGPQSEIAHEADPDTAQPADEPGFSTKKSKKDKKGKKRESLLRSTTDDKLSLDAPAKESDARDVGVSQLDVQESSRELETAEPVDEFEFTTKNSKKNKKGKKRESLLQTQGDEVTPPEAPEVSTSEPRDVDISQPTWGQETPREPEIVEPTDDFASTATKSKEDRKGDNSESFTPSAADDYVVPDQFGKEVEALHNARDLASEESAPVPNEQVPAAEEECAVPGKKSKKDKKKRQSLAARDEIVEPPTLEVGSISTKEEPSTTVSSATEAATEPFDDFGFTSKKSKKDKKKRQSLLRSSTFEDTLEPPTEEPNLQVTSESQDVNVDKEIEPLLAKNQEDGFEVTSKKSKKDKKKRQNMPESLTSGEVLQNLHESMSIEESGSGNITSESQQQHSMPIDEPLLSTPEAEAIELALDDHTLGQPAKDAAPEEPESQFEEFSFSKNPKENKKEKGKDSSDPDSKEASGFSTPLDPLTETANAPPESLPEESLQQKPSIVDELRKPVTKVDAEGTGVWDAFSTKKSKKDKKKKKDTSKDTSGELSAVTTPIEATSKQTSESSLPSGIVLDKAITEEPRELQLDSDKPTTEQDIIEKPEPEPEQDGWSSFSNAKESKKEKKKKKRKSGFSTPVEVIPETPGPVKEPTVEPLQSTSQEQVKEGLTSAEEPMQTSSVQDTVDEPDQDEWASPSTKKSKKDKKKRQSDLSTPIQSIPESSGPTEETVAQPSSVAKQVDEFPITSERPAASTSIQDVTEEPEQDEWSSFSTKKSKKDKKKRKSGVSTPVEEGHKGTRALEAAGIIAPLTAGAAITAVAANKLIDEPSKTEELPVPAVMQDTPEEPAGEEWGYLSRKKSKKDKKKRKSGFSTPIEEILDKTSPSEDPIHIEKQTSTTPAEDVEESRFSDLPVPISAPETVEEPSKLDESPTPVALQKAEEPADEWSSFSTKKSKKDKKNRNSGLSTPVEEIQPPIETAESSTLAQEAFEEAAKPEEPPPIVDREAIVEAADEWAPLSRKQSKKDKKRKSGLSTPAEEETPEMSKDESSSLATREALEKPSAPATSQGATEALADEWAAISTKKSKKDKNRKSGLSTPTEEAPEIAKDKPSSSTATGEVFEEPQNIEEPSAATTTQDAAKEPADESALYSIKKSKKDKKKRKSGLSTPVEETIVESQKPPASSSPPTSEHLRSEEVDTGTGDLSRTPSKKDKRKRQATVDATMPDYVGPTKAPLTSWADEVEEAEVERELPVIEDIAKDESLSHIARTTESSAVDDFIRPTKKGKKDKKRNSGSIGSASMTESFRSSIGEDAPKESSEEHSNIPALAVTGAAALASAAILSKSGEKQSESSPPAVSSSTPARKLSKKEKRKMSIDRRAPREDIFDDPALWEGADPKEFEEESRPQDDDDNDGFWSASQENETHAQLVPSPEPIETSREPILSHDENTQAPPKPPSRSAWGIEQPVPTPLGLTDIPPLSHQDISSPSSEPVNYSHEDRGITFEESPIERVPSRKNRYSTGFSELPIVREESPVRHESDRHHKSEHQDNDTNRDSAFVTGSPIPPQGAFTDSHEHVRDSGVHLRDVSPPKEAVAPVSSSDDALARLSWPQVDEETETVNINRSLRPKVVADKHRHEVKSSRSSHDSHTPEEDRDIDFFRAQRPADERPEKHHPHHEETSNRDLLPSQRTKDNLHTDLHRTRTIHKSAEDRPRHHHEEADQHPDLHRTRAIDGSDEKPKQHDEESTRRKVLPPHSESDEKYADLHRTKTIHGSQAQDKGNLVKQRVHRLESSEHLRSAKPREESSVREHVQRLESPDFHHPSRPKEAKYSELNQWQIPKAERPQGNNDTAIAAGTVALAGAGLGFAAARQLSAEKRPDSAASQRSASNINRLRTPDPKFRSESANSHRSSGTPPLRRSDRKISGDLRSLSQRSQLDLAKEAELAALSTSTVNTTNTANPTANEGRVRAKDMADVYDGFGEGRMGSPRSPTRPHSMRRRQSMQVLDLESKLEQLAAENRILAEAEAQAERTLQESGQGPSSLVEKDAEIDSLKRTLDWLQNEVTRLTEVNDGLASANVTLGRQHNERYNELELQHAQATRDLQETHDAHSNLSAGMEGIVANEVRRSVQEKDQEIAQLRAQLESAKEQIREMQRQILASKAGDSEFLTIRDEDYFDNACQQLCQHVQQWVLRFSKFSDMRACRLTSEINNDKTIDRLDNAILDGSDVDSYLADRVKRRDVFMSMTMTMVWEFIFTRYLFGMDREQRQKLKSLEKLLSEVGPAAAVHQWRATTLTLLSKREAFLQQREQDTEAVVHAVLETLSEILPPPSHLESQIEEQLKRVMKAAVDLSIEMRTQRAEYMMLPPLQPEYDANGDLASKVSFNAALMNERSGDTVSNEELEAQKAVVRIVLFPLVVKKGDDSGEGDEEIVVCPAQVLVAKPKKSVRVFSPDDMAANQSRMSLTSTMPGEGGSVF